MIKSAPNSSETEYKKIRTAIAGATGYTGAELVKLIAGHPQAELTAVTSRSYAGKPFADIFPSFRNIVDIKCEDMNPDALEGRVDCVFLALPHKVSMQYAPLFIEKGIRVIDLSADFRFRELSAYESTYQKHSAPELLKEAVYGLSEIYANEVASASLIGNPGCYPTSLLLPVIPLLRERVIEKSGIVSDSKSGVSGAGRALALSSHYCEVTESFKPYKVGSHRHVPEMEEVLSLQAGEKINITFVPHLLPMSRGMLTTIYAQLSEKFIEEHADGKGSLHKAVSSVLAEYYEKRFFVRILPEGKFPDTAHVRGTNFCDIGIWIDDKSPRVIIVSAIDNILKGAAGQAVQNMNLMFGLDEKSGLQIIPGGI